MSKSDIQLKQDVEDELRWDPKVHAEQIHVTVHDGSVALLGIVDTYPQRWAAEEAAERVAGVRTVAQELTVRVRREHVRRDAEIAEAVLHALEWDVLVPRAVTAQVRHGAVTLEGQVSWDYQRCAAERAVCQLVGVVTTYNAITLEPEASLEQAKEKIETALHRQATTEAKSIEVETHGGRVTLSGHASSFQMIRDARSAAWSVRGVREVDERVSVAATA